MSLKHAPHVGRFAGWHGSWTARELLEQRDLLVFVTYIAAIEHGAPLELAIDIVLVQLRVLYD